MRTMIAITAATLIAITGCSATTEHATASPTTSALPADFPDLTGFTPINADDYRQSYPYFNGIRFTTPGGLTCDQNAMNSLNDPADIVLNCVGMRPDKGPGNWNVAVTAKNATTIEQASSDPPEGNPVKALPANHTIDYEGIRCGVDDKGMTACRIGDHGFVLTPTKTTLF